MQTNRRRRREPWQPWPPTIYRNHKKLQIHRNTCLHQWTTTIQTINPKPKQNPYQALNRMARIQTWGINPHTFTHFMFVPFFIIIFCNILCFPKLFVHITFIYLAQIALECKSSICVHCAVHLFVLWRFDYESMYVISFNLHECKQLIMKCIAPRFSAKYDSNFECKSSLQLQY